jgi:hypothetical protein
MASISPVCKKCKNFISALKSPAYRDFMIKIIKIQDIKISHFGTFKLFSRGPSLKHAGLLSERDSSSIPYLYSRGGGSFFHLPFQITFIPL